MPPAIGFGRRHSTSVVDDALEADDRESHPFLPAPRRRRERQASRRRPHSKNSSSTCTSFTRGQTQCCTEERACRRQADASAHPALAADDREPLRTCKCRNGVISGEHCGEHHSKSAGTCISPGGTPALHRGARPRTLMMMMMMMMMERITMTPNELCTARGPVP